MSGPTLYRVFYESHFWRAHNSDIGIGSKLEEQQQVFVVVACHGMKQGRGVVVDREAVSRMEWHSLHTPTPRVIYSAPQNIPAPSKSQNLRKIYANFTVPALWNTTQSLKMTHTSSAAQLEAVELPSPYITVSHELLLTVPAGAVKDVTVTSAKFSAYRDFKLEAVVRKGTLSVSLSASGNNNEYEFGDAGKPKLKVNQVKVRKDVLHECYMSSLWYSDVEHHRRCCGLGPVDRVFQETIRMPVSSPHGCHGA